jgi:outer membrane protein TolC
LDRFKISLGLTTNQRIVLDDAALEKLSIDETHLNMNLQQAIEVAFASRLDLHTVEDQVEDAQRRVQVAANALLPQADLILSARVAGQPASVGPSIDFDRYAWNAGLDVDLPLDRKAERNGYRSALINHERALRQLENYTDEVRLQIQNGWRNLEQAKRDYQISKIRVELSQNRVREQELLMEIDEGDAFELVRAQDALTGSRNQLTSALVDHTLVRLGFWRDLGLLYIESNGRWKKGELNDDSENS